MLTLKDHIVSRLPLGSLVKFIDTPSGSDYVLDGSLLQRSQYKALDNLYPHPKYCLPTGVGITASFTVNISKIAYGNGIFLATASDSTIAATSTDGITWVQRTMPISAIYSLAYGNGVFALTNSTKVTSTTDGITWSTPTNISNPAVSNMSYGGGKFVACSTNSTYTITSTDGINWIQRTNIGSITGSLTYGNGIFLGLPAGTFTVIRSTDGITWENPPNLPGTDSGWSSTVFADGYFISKNYSNGNVLRTTDGITWESYSHGVSSLYCMGAGDNILVCPVFNSSAFYVSINNGVTWSSPYYADMSANWMSIAYGAGKFVVCANLGGNTKILTIYANPDKIKLPSRQADGIYISNQYVKVRY